MLDRFLLELQAARPSARILRQVGRNRKAASEVAAKLHVTRKKLAGHDATLVREPADAPAGK